MKLIYFIVFGAIAAIAIVLSIPMIPVTVERTQIYFETEYQTFEILEPYTEMEDVEVGKNEIKEPLRPVVAWLAGMYFQKLGNPQIPTYYFGFQVPANSGNAAIDACPDSAIEIILSPALRSQQAYIRAVDLTGIGQVPAQPTLTSRPEDEAAMNRWKDYIRMCTAPERYLGEFLVTSAEAAPVDEKIEADRIVFDAAGIQAFGIFANTYYSLPISQVSQTCVVSVMEKQPVTREKPVPREVPVQVEKERMVIEHYLVSLWHWLFSR